MKEVGKSWTFACMLVRLALVMMVTMSALMLVMMVRFQMVEPMHTLEEMLVIILRGLVVPHLVIVHLMRLELVLVLLLQWVPKLGLRRVVNHSGTCHQQTPQLSSF